MDVERSIVVRVLRSQTMAPVHERELESHHFLQRVKDDASPVPMPGEVFAWISNHVRRYRSVPSLELAEAAFPLFQFIDTTDDLGALADEMRRQVKRREGIMAVRHLADAVDDPTKLDDLEIHFFEAAAAMARAVPATSITRFSDSLNRLDLYKERQRTGQVPGVSLVVPMIDDLTYGAQSHEMVIIEGFLGQRKSSLAIKACGKAYFERDQTPLFFSLEMEGDKLAQKWDAMAAEFAYSAAKRLELGEGDLERWYKIGEKASDSKFEKDILVIDDVRRITEDTIFAEVERWRPDFSVVDTLDEVRAPNHIKSHWEKQDYVARELKGICRATKRPMIVIAQAGREAEKEGATLGNIAGCVPLDTMILTQRGWLRHDEVVVGDKTVGYDPDIDASVWTDVQAIVHYEQQDVVRFGHKKWDVVVTPNHRWVTDTRSRKSSTGRLSSMTETRDVDHAHRVRLSSPFVQDGVGIGDLDAELVGWLWGDGSVFDNTGRTGHKGAPGFNMLLYQAKPHGLVLLRELLASIPHYDYVQERQEEGWYPKHTFRIESAWAREMWIRTGLDHLTPVEFVLSLDPSGIQALLRGLWGAEGWMNGNHRMMAQNHNSPVFEAMVLATYLGGYRPCISNNRLTTAGNMNMNIHFGGPFVTGQWCSMVDEPGKQDVWCVQTELGSWTMRQGEHVALTGNSITIARKADIAIGIHATPDMKKLHRADMTLLKNRDDGGEGTVVATYFNPGTMECRDWRPSDGVATKS